MTANPPLDPSHQERDELKARIGVVDSTKVIEIDVEDPADFRATVEESIASSDAIAWFTDSKKRMVGVPTGHIAYVEIESEESERSVGFAP